ncbi:MAG: hypothetical protein AMXMBFR59_00430 [Rhodanobacteraceae bacterium]
MIGTFVRNVLLVQTQLSALLLAMSQFPLRLFHAMSRWSGAAPGVSLSMAGGLCVFAAVLLGWIGALAGRPPRAEAEDQRPRPSVALAALGVTVAHATGSFLGAIGLSRLVRLPEPWESLSLAMLPGQPHTLRLAVTTAALYVAVWPVWIGFDTLLSAMRRNDDEWRSPLQRHPLRFLFATVRAAVFSGFAILGALRVLAPWGSGEGTSSGTA